MIPFPNHVKLKILLATGKTKRGSNRIGALGPEGLLTVGCASGVHRAAQPCLYPYIHMNSLLSCAQPSFLWMLLFNLLLSISGERGFNQYLMNSLTYLVSMSFNSSILTLAFFLYKSIPKVHIYNHKCQASTLSFRLFILHSAMCYVQHDKFISLQSVIRNISSSGKGPGTLCFLHSFLELDRLFKNTLQECLQSIPLHWVRG